MLAPNNKSSQKESWQDKVSLSLICIVVVVIVALAALISFLLNSDEESPEVYEPSNRTFRIDDFKPSRSIDSSKPREDADQSSRVLGARYEEGVEVVSENVRTNSSGAVIEKLTLADGRKISKIRPPKSQFQNTADQVIALAVSTQPGRPMPPLPDISNIDKEFANSLLSQITINDTDPEDVKEIKAKVLEVKAYLIEEIKNGGSVMDALVAHQKEMDRISDSHLMAVQELQKLRAEEGEEAAHEFMKRINEVFRARDIPEIEIPTDIKDAKRK